MAEELLEISLGEELDSRFINNIILEDRELDDEENLKLITLYEGEFGYGYEE